MLRFLLRRLALTLPTFVALMFVTFVAIRMVPGDPVEVRVGERGISAERLAQFRHELGLYVYLFRGGKHLLERIDAVVDDVRLARSKTLYVQDSDFHFFLFLWVRREVYSSVSLCWAWYFAMMGAARWYAEACRNLHPSPAFAPRRPSARTSW